MTAWNRGGGRKRNELYGAGQVRMGKNVKRLDGGGKTELEGTRRSGIGLNGTGLSDK